MVSRKTHGKRPNRGCTAGEWTLSTATTYFNCAVQSRGVERSIILYNNRVDRGLTIFQGQQCEIRNVPTAVDRTVSSTKISRFFTMEVPIIDLHGISVLHRI
jgi:hypothetical protein